MTYVLEQIDWFKRDIPGFNLKGKQHVSSVYGGLMTTVMLVVMLLYAGLKLGQLVNRENPNVSTFAKEF